jgi:hypothetical protein
LKVCTVVCSNGITTRSDWTYCIFCKKKNYKKDHKLHKIESQNRMKKILDAARHNSDYEKFTPLSTRWKKFKWATKLPFSGKHSQQF